MDRDPAAHRTGGGDAGRPGRGPARAVVGLALQAVGLAWLGLIASPDLGYATLAVPLVVTGIGVSMAIPVVQNTVSAAWRPTLSAKHLG